MSKIEEILTAKEFEENHQFRGLNIHQIMDEYAKYVNLSFTKWKDDNYPERYNDLFFKHLQFKGKGKTREQLFDEWNNLKK